MPLPLEELPDELLRNIASLLLTPTCVSGALRLCGVSKCLQTRLDGVNALAQKRRLCFDPQLTSGFTITGCGATLTCTALWSERKWAVGSLLPTSG
eukprot:1483810-Prymnesium_polylepis.1